MDVLQIDALYALHVHHSLTYYLFAFALAFASDLPNYLPTYLPIRQYSPPVPYSAL